MLKSLLTCASLALLLLLTPHPAFAQDNGKPADSTKSEKKKKDAPLPLAGTRSVHLDTDEGTWLSVDVSPDGKSIVFDLLGDLYTAPLAGGDATRLTSSLAFDTQPRFSPDGTKLLFISDRSGGDNLWTIDLATGDSTQITKGDGNAWMSPDWTPDGNYVVASKGQTRLGVTQLWIGHIDGGSGKVLRSEPEALKTVGAAVSPDGRYIWHAQRTGSWQYNAQLPQYQLAVYDRETGETFNRTSRYGSAFRPTLSPDGKWLVYGTRHDAQTGLRIRNLADGDERWLAFPVSRDEQESIADRDIYPGMDFTPDSKELVASYGGKVWRIPVDGSDPIAVPIHISTDVAVGPELDFRYPIEDTPQFTIRQIRDAVPSPDGTKLAFTALDELYIMDYPNGTPRRIAAQDGMLQDRIVQAEPAWSSDGTWLAWVTWGANGGQIFKARADGRGGVVQVTRASAEYQQPAWTASGDRIVALRNPTRVFRESTGPVPGGAEMDIVWVPSAGGDATLIAPAQGRMHPHFVHGSDRIYLYSGAKGLVSIRFDGTDEKALVKVTGATRPGQKQPDRADVVLMAPEGDQALAQLNDDLYVVTVPMLGGDATTISVADPSSAAFPARRLTDIGGQFPAWGNDGRKAHWSIGNAHFVFDLDDAKTYEDSVAAAKKAAEAAADSADVGGAPVDSAAVDTAGAVKKDDEKKKEGYKPIEKRILIQAARDVPTGDVVLRGGRVVTMKRTDASGNGDSDSDAQGNDARGNGAAGDEVIENADVVIHNNRITAIGARGSVTVPPGAKVIDVTGKTIIPGFVDTHSHMWPAWGIHKTQEWIYLANLAYGVTTTRDPQTSSTDVLTYSDLVTSGRMIGPRVYSTGPGIFGDYVSDAIKTKEQANDIMRRYSDYYDTKYIKMYMSGNRQIRQWIIMAAKEHNIKPTTEGGLMFKYELTMALDGYPGQEHALPIAPIYSDVVTLFSDIGITYTPTLLVSYGGPFAENYFY